MSYLSPHLDAISSLADVELAGETFGQRLAHLSSLTMERDEFNRAVWALGRHKGKMINLANRNANRADDGVAENFYELVAAQMMFALLAGIEKSHRSGGRKPQRHHWVPNSYLRGFDQRDANSRGTLPVIPVLRYDRMGYTEPNLTSNGKELRHSTEGYRDFYPLAMEYAFSRIESAFSRITPIINARADKPAWVGNRDLMTLVSMLLVQSVRLPECGTEKEFVKHDFAALADLLDEKLTALSRLNPCVAFVDSSTRLGFTLKAPVISANSGLDTVSTIYFPFGPHAALILSSKPIDEAKRIEVATGFHWRMLSETRRNGEDFYGVKAEHVRSGTRRVSIDMAAAYLSISDTSVRRANRFAINGANESRAMAMKANRGRLHAEAVKSRKAAATEEVKQALAKQQALAEAHRAKSAQELARIQSRNLAASALMRSIAAGGRTPQMPENAAAVVGA